jgi:hypothetical protein
MARLLRERRAKRIRPMTDERDAGLLLVLVPSPDAPQQPWRPFQPTPILRPDLT